MVFRQMGPFVDGAGQKEYEKNAEISRAVKTWIQSRRMAAEFHLPKLSCSEKGQCVLFQEGGAGSDSRRLSLRPCKLHNLVQPWCVELKGYEDFD